MGSQKKRLNETLLMSTKLINQTVKHDDDDVDDDDDDNDT